MKNGTRASWRLLGPALVLVCLGILSCGEEEPTAPEDRQVSPTAKPASGDPSVSATDPTSAPQDTTLDVRVVGSNFDRGSRADLALDCEVECTLSPTVQTNSTRFIGPSELVANITIAADATVEVYDVLVTTSKGKRGIGIELFAVRESQARSASKEYDQTVIGKLPGAGSCRSTEINDLGDVAGYCSFGSGVYHGFFWRDGLGMIDLGEVLNNHIGYGDLSDGGPSGPIVIWHTPQYGPTIWQPIASSAPEALPAPDAFLGEPGEGCAPRAKAITGAGDLIVGQVCVAVDGQISTMPVIWRRTGMYWSWPEFLPLADGRESGSAYQVSKHGVIAGILRPNTNPWDWFVWFPPYTSAPEPIPFGAYSSIWIDGINDAGDAAGRGDGPYVVFWKRNGMGWDVQEISDTGAAYGINESSDVVGTWDGGLRVWSFGFTTYVDHGYGYEINASGAITGRDEDGNLRGRAVKWTPK